MSARKKKTPSAAGTPSLLSFFSPAGRPGPRFERPNSASNAGGSPKLLETPKRIEQPRFDVPSPTPPKLPTLPSPSPKIAPKRAARRIACSDDDDDFPLKRPRSENFLESMSFKNAGSGAIAAIAAPPKIVGENAEVGGGGSLPIWQTNPKDRKGRRPDHLDYDPTTILVPESALAKMTPAQRQYWDVKKDHFDMVLFFKVGKFYELFDADALIGNRHLNLLMMKGERPHAGFPERSFGKYAERLVQLGFKVARVEQVETPNDLKERNMTTGSKSKVVNRELCSILTKGTLTEEELIGSPKASFLLALVESATGAEYGVCFCDTATARFHIGQFVDDSQRTRCRTLLACVAPSEVVFPATGLQPITRSILRKDLPVDVLRNPIAAPWSAEATMDTLPDYFPDCALPDLFTAPDRTLATTAFGAVVLYLRRCLLDEELVKIGTFLQYDPNDADTSCFMALDGQTIGNLEIVQNAEGNLQGSLLECIDHCVTPFGHRRLREWIIRPLVRPVEINDRLDAVEELIQGSEARERLRKSLKTLPDLGRLLSRIHAHACGRDSKAVMYENVGAARLNMFLDVLGGFRQATEWFRASSHGFSAPLLRRLTTLGAVFPDLTPILAYLDQAFDADAARRDAIIIPSPGIDPDYDEAQNGIEDVKRRLERLLVEERNALKDRSIEFVHKNNEKYQLEVPESTIKRLGRMPDRYEKVSQRKGFVRYYTGVIRACTGDLERANEKRSAALASTMRRIFAEFCRHHALWTAAVAALADLDCLCALALASESNGEPMCRPEFVERSDSAPFLDLRGARHPSLATTATTAASFIPNDTQIGTAVCPAPFLLVTGPNMGGKSTLLRQTCLCVVLAQLGCYVPAASCRLTPVDRIFTRVGACDRILSGQSTFFVELEETATILRHASRHSLVILDELGRGTSTFDGTAIAYAVARHLSQKIRCRTLFATHYHVLSREFHDDNDVAAYHMASLPDPSSQTIVFLYKFVPGVCPASFGANIAKMAGLPREIILQAETVTKQFEDLVQSSVRDRLRQCLKRRDPAELRELCREFASYMITA